MTPLASGGQELRTRWLVGCVLAIVAAVLMVLAVVASVRILTTFEEINLSASDNVDWSLAQTELESRDFTAALDAAIAAPVPDLDKLRMRFDILYSRIDTLNVSPHYKLLNEEPVISDAADRLRQFTTNAVPIIDSPDLELRSSLLQLRDLAAGLRADTRQISISGLALFAKRSDRERAVITRTLMRLAGLAVLLVTALTGLVIYVFTIYRKARQRGRDLAQANQRMHTILTTSQDGVIVTDQHGVVLEFNAAAEQIFQLDFAAIQGRQILDLIAPENSIASHTAALHRMRSNRGGHIGGRGRVQIEAKRADGTVFPMEIAIEPAFDGPQELFVAFVRDISKRVEAEQELVEARDHALAGEQAKADFLNVMSHEIRTPLNGVLGNLSMLNDTVLDTRQTRFVRNMEISGRVLMRHVDSVLDIARFESGKLDFDMRPTNLGALITDLINSQIGLAESRGTALGWHWVGPPLSWVHTDPAALEQVLLNLLGNAIKFTPQGTISVEIETLPDTQNGLPLIELRVIDTGIGIPADGLGTIFDDFVTRDVSLGRVTGGTGLGLGIARRIVEALDGQIGVQSTQDQGSTFWVRLPMERAKPMAHQISDTTVAGGTKALAVLVVEDNDINRELACDMLMREGHSVTSVCDGAAGVAAARRGQFDLILMDIAMPLMDGLEATRLIRSGSGASCAVPIVALSANILPDEKDRFMRAGMTSFLAKPLNRKNLHNLVSSLEHAPLPPTHYFSPAKPEDTDTLINFDHFTNNFQDLGQAARDGLIQRFISDMDRFLPDLATLCATDLVSLAAKCHANAGSAAVFGATKLRARLVGIEIAAKAGDRRTIRDQLKPLSGLWQDTKSALQKHQIQPQDSRAAPQPVDGRSA